MSSHSAVIYCFSFRISATLRHREKNVKKFYVLSRNTDGGQRDHETDLNFCGSEETKWEN